MKITNFLLIAVLILFAGCNFPDLNDEDDTIPAAVPLSNARANDPSEEDPVSYTHLTLPTILLV